MAETMNENARGWTRGRMSLLVGLLAAAVCAADGDCRMPANAVVVQDAPGYNAWPMIQAFGTNLVCTYSRDRARPADGHGIGAGSRDVYAKVSADGGRTWSPERVVAADPVVGEVNEGIGLDSTGAVLAWVRCWGAPERRRHELYRTADGVTFERLAVPRLDPMPMQVTDIVRVSGLGLVSPWFAGEYRKDGRNSWGLLVSADEGRTWEQRTVESGLSVKEWVTEPSLVSLGGGRLLVVGRCEQGLGTQFQVTSADGGRTWTKARTNIGDVWESTPSLVYDAQSGLVANYYYQRGARRLKRRVAKADFIFSHPTAWPEPEVLAEGFEPRAWDAGNVNATRFSGTTDLCAWYTGTPSNATVVVTSAPVPASGRAARPAEIRPGALWYDTAGHVINAHGGGVLFDGGTYWWYGEHKVYGRAGNRAHVGVHAYSSRDLVNWDDRGVALAVSDDPQSDIADGCILERPKVLRSRKTSQYVMYFHLELKGRGYGSARTGIAVADRPEGPFRFLRSFRPTAGAWPEDARAEERTPEAMRASKELGDESGGPSERVKARVPYLGHIDGGQMSRDMTLFADDDGRCYHVFASEYNATLHIAELTDDLLGYTGRWFRVAEKHWTEAPALVKHGGWYFLLGSGCTGWRPNAARLYRAKSLRGPWERLGNPCRGVRPETGLGPALTWGAQSTFLLPVAGRPGEVIALFDIWHPANHEESRYVWLPVTFEDDRLRIDWTSSWRP